MLLITIISDYNCWKKVEGSLFGCGLIGMFVKKIYIYESIGQNAYLAMIKTGSVETKKAHSKQNELRSKGTWERSLTLAQIFDMLQWATSQSVSVKCNSADDNNNWPTLWVNSVTFW